MYFKYRTSTTQLTDLPWKVALTLLGIRHLSRVDSIVYGDVQSP